MPESLAYDADDFAVRARRLIGSRQPFSFEIPGEGSRQLAPYIVDGKVTDPPKLGLKPKLQLLLAIMMLADAEGQAVGFEVHNERIRVWVGIGRA